MTTEQRLEAMERSQSEMAEKLKGVRAEVERLRLRLGEGEELTAMQQVNVRALAREIHDHGWPQRSRRSEGGRR